MKAYRVQVHNYPMADITDYIVYDEYFYLNKEKAENMRDALDREYNYDAVTWERFSEDNIENEIVMDEIEIRE